MITREELKTFVENNPKLVSMKESTRYPGLFVIKYSRKVFYDNLWNDILEECRGLVVDKDYNPVVRPFKKIYNRFERDTDIDPEEYVYAVEKINGFMAAVTKVNGYDELIVSTTGSLDSPFVDLATKHLSNINPKHFNEGFTYLFEIVDETDPHIISEVPGAYLIGCRAIHDGYLIGEDMLNVYAYDMGCERPSHEILRFREVVHTVRRCCFEGYVVRGLNTTLKIKSPYYLFNKFFARCKNTDKLLNANIKETMDEEFYPVIDSIQENIEEFSALDEQDRLKYIQSFILDGM